MAVSDETILLSKTDKDENTQAAMILKTVYSALKEAGHNPSAARKLISGIERDELLEELIRYYVKGKGL